MDKKSKAKTNNNKPKLLLNNRTKAKGLPAKSFMYIIDLDYYLRIALSHLANSSFFDLYIASHIKYKYKQKDRKHVADSFLKYLCIYDESRVNDLFYSKFINREILILFFNELYKSIKQYEDILKKDIESISNEDLKFIWQFQYKFGKFTSVIHRNFPFILEKVNKTISLITDHYLSFILKNLMLRRISIDDPNKLKADSYEVIIDMINSYNPAVSKVPFNNYLTFFIKNRKNKIITEEISDSEKNIVSLDEIYGSQNDEIDNEIFQASEKYIYRDRNIDEYLDLIERVSNELPKHFKDLLLLNFNIVNQLSVSEELNLLL